jgi:hypothetical protein
VSEWEPIKIIFKNSAYEPDFTRAPLQASLAKSTQPLKYTQHAMETHTTRLLAAQTGQAGF